MALWSFCTQMDLGGVTAAVADGMSSVGVVPHATTGAVLRSLMAGDRACTAGVMTAPAMTATTTRMRVLRFMGPFS